MGKRVKRAMLCSLYRNSSIIWGAAVVTAVTVFTGASVVAVVIGVTMGIGIVTLIGRFH